MSETILLDIRLKPESLDMPQEAETDLLASVYPELLVLMQQQSEAED
ncbi:hypothetical protein [Propionivibrio dicarboxylicus]|uniref:Uncharacterized protein n=1 Tax=Propionivibrio dicarboxylicus TaxID=83767 RepID=A0A1G7WMQ1_9RHOO|nr:hypothetical protein [Propionivibrio dicarboxylicus]SDG73212.1 hypothetical protein SAMN05660652_00573 [Propionivibrio dicarboxylicus]